MSERDSRPGPVLDYPATSGAKRSRWAYAGQAIAGVLAGAGYVFVGGVFAGVWFVRGGTDELRRAIVVFVAFALALVATVAWFARGKRWTAAVVALGITLGVAASLAMYLLYKS